MAQSGGQEQPSMEEILASIRRIISEDEAVESERPALSVADEQPEEDVLELTDRVEQTDARAKDQSASEAEAAQAAPADRPGRRPAVSEPTAEASAAEGLLSGQAAAAAVAALSQAARRSSDSSGNEEASGEGQTLDALVRQALTPLLKAWLDQNLPPLVERIVREEVRRLAQQAGDG